jgi:hypothetical protein
MFHNGSPQLDLMDPIFDHVLCIALCPLNGYKLCYDSAELELLGVEKLDYLSLLDLRRATENVKQTRLKK